MSVAPKKRIGCIKGFGCMTIGAVLGIAGFLYVSSTKGCTAITETYQKVDSFVSGKFHEYVSGSTKEESAQPGYNAPSSILPVKERILLLDDCKRIDSQNTNLQALLKDDILESIILRIYQDGREEVLLKLKGYDNPMTPETIDSALSEQYRTGTLLPHLAMYKSCKDQALIELRKKSD